MHILAGIVSLLTVASIVLWRLHMASRAASDLADMAGGVQKHIRKRRWQKKLGDPLRDVDDPRVAAAAMMVALAQTDSPLSEKEESVITTMMRGHFDVDDTLAAELLAHARWLVRDVTEPENCFLKVRPIILSSCGPKERGDLIDMMNAVALVGSDVDGQKAIVGRLQHSLKS